MIPIQALHHSRHGCITSFKLIIGECNQDTISNSRESMALILERHNTKFKALCQDAGMGGIHSSFTKKKKRNEDTLNASGTVPAKDGHGLYHHDVTPFDSCKMDDQGRSMAIDGEKSVVHIPLVGAPPLSNELKEDKTSDHLSFASKKDFKGNKSAVDITLVGEVARSNDLTEFKRSDHIRFGTDKEVDGSNYLTGGKRSDHPNFATDKEGGADKSGIAKTRVDDVARSIDLTVDKRSGHLSFNTDMEIDGEKSVEHIPLVGDLPVSNELKDDKTSDHLSFATKKDFKGEKSAVDIT